MDIAREWGSAYDKFSHSLVMIGETISHYRSPSSPSARAAWAKCLRAEDHAPRPPGRAEISSRGAGPPIPSALERFHARGARRIELSITRTSAPFTTPASTHGRPYLVMEVLEGQTLRETHRRPPHGSPTILARLRQL